MVVVHHGLATGARGLGHHKANKLAVRAVMRPFDAKAFVKVLV